MKNVILKIENLTHVFGQDTPFECVALDNINLDVYDNDFLAIVGRTGSGKSTLVQHFNALQKPTSGAVYYKGDNIWQKSFDRRFLRFNVGMAFQYPEYQLFEETVESDISFGPINMGLDPDVVKARVSSAMDFVGLDSSLLGVSPFNLSGGQKRRVALAGVMAIEPEVLILDEPTAGLDPKGHDEIMSSINRYRSETEKSVILVSHCMEDVLRYADRVAVMRDGKLLAVDSVKKVFSDPDFVKDAGLSLPHLTRIFSKLNKLGYGFDCSVQNSAEAVDMILKKIKRARESGR